MMSAIKIDVPGPGSKPLDKSSVSTSVTSDQPVHTGPNTGPNIQVSPVLLVPTPPLFLTGTCPVGCGGSSFS